jgi:hypothetical protein
VEDRELAAVVLEKPQLGVDLQLKTVRGRGGVAPRVIALHDSVPHDE